jgi:hypothetical protein
MLYRQTGGAYDGSVIVQLEGDSSFRLRAARGTGMEVLVLAATGTSWLRMRVLQAERPRMARERFWGGYR